MTSQKNALCVIFHRPKIYYFDFLNKLKNYDIYVIIDDNLIDYSRYKNRFENIMIIQILNGFCKNNGYVNSNRIGIKKMISGWDKALCYFSLINKKYDYVWFMEDDVFFYDETTIMNIDNKYPSFDILANCDFKEGNYSKWLWNIIKINLPKPYYSGMMCAIRLSKNVLDEIDKYASKNKCLFFIEALFPTIVSYNNFTYFHPDELKTIRYKFEWNERNVINKTCLYHPLKDDRYHVYLRHILNSKK
jgi:hypothetical protein